MSIYMGSSTSPVLVSIVVVGDLPYILTLSRPTPYKNRRTTSFFFPSSLHDIHVRRSSVGAVAASSTRL